MENAENSLAEDRRLRAPPEKEKRPLASKALDSAGSGEALPRIAIRFQMTSLARVGWVARRVRQFRFSMTGGWNL